MDVYIWIGAENRQVALVDFIDDYVDKTNPGEHRFDAFIRTFVTQDPQPGDRTLLAELSRESNFDSGLTVYLRARDHHGAIIAITEEGGAVVGLSLDDPDNSPAVLHEAGRLLEVLRARFNASAGLAGVELAPPQSAEEWREDASVQLRVGHL